MIPDWIGCCFALEFTYGIIGISYQAVVMVLAPRLKTFLILNSTEHGIYHAYKC